MKLTLIAIAVSLAATTNAVALKKSPLEVTVVDQHGNHLASLSDSSTGPVQAANEIQGDNSEKSRPNSANAYTSAGSNLRTNPQPVRPAPVLNLDDDHRAASSPQNSILKQQLTGGQDPSPSTGKGVISSPTKGHENSGEKVSVQKEGTPASQNLNKISNPKAAYSNGGGPGPNLNLISNDGANKDFKQGKGQQKAVPFNHESMPSHLESGQSEAGQREDVGPLFGEENDSANHAASKEKEPTQNEPLRRPQAQALPLRKPQTLTQRPPQLRPLAQPQPQRKPTKYKPAPIQKQVPSRNFAQSNAIDGSQDENDASGESSLSGIRNLQGGKSNGEDLLEENRELLEYHNEVRKAHGCGELEWDHDLEADAQRHVSTADCYNLKHTERQPGANIGENLATDASALDGATKWYGEIELMHPNSYTLPFAFSHDTGHYTQMIWGTTTKIGCATKICKGQGNFRDNVYVLCSYSDAGNMQGAAGQINPPKQEYQSLLPGQYKGSRHTSHKSHKSKTLGSKKYE